MNNESADLAISQYLKLRENIDNDIQRLLQIHSDHIACREKCSRCCVNLSVFPVEFYAIQAELGDSLSEFSFNESASCGFLRNDLCVLYSSRPLICRTHGLPIVFLSDELDPPQYAVDFCPDNFAGPAGELVEFSPDNILNIDQMNEQLFEINQTFVKALANTNITPLTRIPLKNLLK